MVPSCADAAIFTLESEVFLGGWLVKPILALRSPPITENSTCSTCKGKKRELPCFLTFLLLIMSPKHFEAAINFYVFIVKTQHQF